MTEIYNCTGMENSNNNISLKSEIWKIRKIDSVIPKTGNQVENQESSVKIGRFGISVSHGQREQTAGHTEVIIKTRELH